MRENMILVCPKCKENHETTEVEFLDIEEDIRGYDLMTFICPTTGEVGKSLVYGNG